MNPFAAINYIRKGIGYDEFCAEYADYRRIRADELYDVLDELQESARGYEDYDGWFAHIENYTRELERLYQSQEKQSESVALSTLHSAKGLEYENVYLIDVNEGVMPYKKAVLDQDIEEERRMFYVGMTPGKKISASLFRQTDESERCRYLALYCRGRRASQSSMSLNSASSSHSSKRSDTASYSASSKILSRDGLPSLSSA